MNSRFLRHLQLILAALDLLSINAVFFAAVFIVNKNFFNEEFLRIFFDRSAINPYFGFILTIAWSTIILLGGLYHEKYVLSFELFTKRSMHAFVYFLLLVSIYTLFFEAEMKGFIMLVLGSISGLIGLQPLSLPGDTSLF